MTSGERMVWAAEFVRRRATCTAPEAVCWAARAVEAMSSAQGSTRLDPPARRMLEDMLGTGSDRKPAVEPTHDHAFEGNGCDCDLCGEGRAHYLHQERVPVRSAAGEIVGHAEVRR